jgi:hypothetical protein
MMNGPWVFPRRFGPGFYNLQDKKAVFGCHPRINHLAFEIGIALADERHLDAGSGVSRKCLNLSIRFPEMFPQPITLAASSTVGMLITHSLVAFKMLKV